MQPPNADCSTDLQKFNKMKRCRNWIFLAISATYLISYFHRAAPAVVGPEIMKELALAPTALGLIGSMYFWAYAATALPAGILADTWGARKTISAFVFLAGIGGFLFALAPSMPWMALGRFIIGFGVGVVYVAAMRILSDWYRPDEMGTYSGLLLAIGNIGALISTIPLVFLMENTGWRNAFIIVAILTLIASGIAYVVIRNKPAELGYASVVDMESTSSSKLSLKKTIKTVFGNKRFYLLGLLLFSYYGSFMGVGSLWAGPYLQNIYGMSRQGAGSILMMFPLGMVIGCPLSGFISDKILRSRKKVLFYGCVLHILCYVPLIIFTRDMSNIVLYLLFFGYGLTGGAFVSCFACAKEIFEPKFAGTAVGSLNIFLFSGGAFYQNIMGSIINSYPVVSPGVYSMIAYRAAFVVPLCGLMIGLIAFCFFDERREDKDAFRDSKSNGNTITAVSNNIS